MLPAWITVVGLWIGSATLLLGLSLGMMALVKQSLLSEPFRSGNWADAVWFGYASVIGLLQVLHLVSPINTTVLLVICGFAAGGWIHFGWSVWRNRATYRLPAMPSKWRMLALLPLIVSLALGLVWIAHRALSPQLDFDTGFYHLSSIRWLNEYPIVPGLANLHYRLGFNQTSFLWVALLNTVPPTQHGVSVGNSFLLVLTLMQLLSIVVEGVTSWRLNRVATETKQSRHTYASLIYGFAAIMLPVTIFRAWPQRFSANVSSPSPDLIVFLLHTVTLLACLRLLFPRAAQSERERAWLTALIITLSLLGILTKLSFAPFALVTIGIALATWIVRSRRWVTPLLVLALLGLLLGAPYLVRGVIQSGYPLFPSRFAAFPVDYRVPSAIAREAELWIYSFARQPQGEIDTVLADWKWVAGWWSRMQDPFHQFLFVWPLYGFMALAGIGVALALLRRRMPIIVVIPLLPSIAGALGWFLTAPDPRFAGAVFWLSAAWIAAVVIGSLGDRIIRLGAVLSLSLSLGLIIVSLSTNTVWQTEFPRLPRPPLRQFRTDSGLIYWMPNNPNNPLNAYDAPLPNSPYEHPGLRLRGERLGDGFQLKSDKADATR